MTVGAKRKANSREALLEAAGQLFVAKGYEGVSTREIAELAGVNLGAIQYHFGSKASLFLETVHSMMEDSTCSDGWFIPKESLESKTGAINELCRFVASFLGFLLHKADSNPCRLMFREIFSATSQDEELLEGIVSSVVNEFMRPVDELLCDIIGAIAADRPAAERSEAEIARAVRSVLGQCSFYATHRPFMERLHNQSFTEPSIFRETVEFICSFSLRALHCSDAEIADAMQSLTISGEFCKA